MSDGPVSNGVKVAGGIVDGLKSSPVLLALVVFNALFVAVVYFGSADNKARQAEMVAHLLKNQAQMQEMLSRCTGPRSDVTVPDTRG
jgi:hypothetical protein